MGSQSTQPRKHYLLIVWDMKITLGILLIPQMGKTKSMAQRWHLMSRTKLLIVCFFHWWCHHSISALPRNTGNPRAASWRSILVHNKDPWVHLDPKSTLDFGSRQGLQTKGFKPSGSRPQLFALQLANYSQTPGFPIQLFMTLQTNHNLCTGLSTTGKFIL